MSKQSQGSLALVGAFAAGVAIVACAALMVVGGFSFAAAMGLSVAAAAVVAIVLTVGLHRSATTAVRPTSEAAHRAGAAPREGERLPAATSDHPGETVGPAAEAAPRTAGLHAHENQVGEPAMGADLRRPGEAEDPDR